jgi:hypothetical protein
MPGKRIADALLEHSFLPELCCLRLVLTTLRKRAWWISKQQNTHYGVAQWSYALVESLKRQQQRRSLVCKGAPLE